MALQSYSASLIIIDNHSYINIEKLKKDLNIDPLIKPKSILIKQVKNSKNNEKYAIATFSSMEEAIQFMMKMKEKKNCLQSFLLTPVSEMFIKYNICSLSISIDSHKVDVDQLYDTFQAYGQIEFFKFNHGHGIVTFQRSINAFKAMIELKNKLFNGYPINFQMTQHFNNISTISSFIKKSKKIFIKKSTNSPHFTSTPAFLFDIPMNDLVDEDLIKQIFEKYQITLSESGVICKTRYNCEGNLVRYAIIHFATHEMALKAIENVDNNEISGDLLEKSWKIHLLIADEETISILKTNKGKIMFKGTPKKTKILDSFYDEMVKHGDVIDYEMHVDFDKSQFHSYVHFRKIEDAKKVVAEYNGAKLYGAPVEVTFCREASEKDKDKLYLYENLYEESQPNSLINFYLPQNDMINSFQSICQFDKNDDFLIFVDDKQIKCREKIFSFLSPLIAKKLQNEKDFMSFSISTNNFFDKYKGEKLFSFLLYQIPQFPSRNELKDLIIEKIQNFSNSSIETQLKDGLSIAYNCAHSCLCCADHMKRNKTVLDLAILIKLYDVFENEHIKTCITNSFLENVLDLLHKKKTINCEESLLIRFQIKDLLICYKLIENADKYVLYENEIIYLIFNFFYLSSDALNEIDLEIIELAISSENFENINEDLFLFKILRLNDEYKKQLLNFVNFCYISNDAMKYFLQTISFSEISDKLFGLLSIRLSMPLDYDYINSNISIQKSNSDFKYSFLAQGFSNILKLLNDSDFSFYVNEEEIRSNLIIATLISPLITKNLLVDITCSSFTIDFDSFLESFNKIYESLSYFLYLKTTKNKISKQLIQIKIVEALNQIVQFTDLSEFSEFLASLDKLFAEIEHEENSEKKDEIILYFSILINLFIAFGNSFISENLINLFLFESNKITKAIINNKETLISRMKYKEILSFNNALNIDYSLEIRFIALNFGVIMSNIASIDDIDEINWKIISMRLSIPIKQFDIPVYFNDNKNSAYNIGDFSDFDDFDLDEP